MGSMIIDRENDWNEIGNYQDIAIEVLKLRADNTDLLSACEGALAMLDELFPADIFTGESGDVGPVLIAENRARLQAAIAKARGSDGQPDPG